MPTPARTLTHNGRTLTLAEWSAKTGIPVQTIRWRIDHLGKSVAEALTTPSQTKYNPRAKSDPMPLPCPVPRKHTSGQACVRWSGVSGRRVRYLGVWGSREAAEAYRRFQLEWAGGDLAAAGGDALTVGGLAAKYLDHARRYYTKDGKATSELAAHKAALAYLRPFVGRRIAEVKGAVLKSCQQAMVAAGLARKTVNKYAWCIQRCFRWGVGEDLVPPDVAAVLESVPHLQAGRSSAADNPPVRSVSAADVARTFGHLSADPDRREVLADMLRLLEVSGMRPGELCAMTDRDLDTTGAVWRYHAPNKNLHREATRRPRVVWLGPKAQEILAPYLADPGPGGRLWCLPPRAEGGRRVPVTRGRLGQIVLAACRAARVEPWHPHQLRHNRATEVLRIYEDDRAAAAAIGDTPEVARLVYADPQEAAARRIALATG